MRWKRIFSMASENMKQRRLRTSLTTLGVIIGISAIIALASLGEGFRTTVKTRMEQGFELDVLTVTWNPVCRNETPTLYGDRCEKRGSSW